MELKQNAAGRKPAASHQRKTASTDKAHDTTTSNRLNLHVIFSRVNLEALVEQAGAKLQRSGGALRGQCPLHKGDNPTAFVIYTDPHGQSRWHCHTKCDAGGDTIDFVQRW